MDFRYVIMCMRFYAADLWLMYLSAVDSDMSDMYNYAHAIMLPIIMWLMYLLCNGFGG